MSATDYYDLIGIGVAAVDDMLYVGGEYPRANVKMPITSIERHGGGPACTAVAAVAKLGGRSAFVGRLGVNEESKFIKTSLGVLGVGDSPLIHDPAAAPYHSYIVSDSSGSRNVFFDHSRFKPISPEDLPHSLIASARLILLDHVADPALIDVAHKIRAVNVPLLGDIECCSASALELVQLTDYLVVPEQFACWATGAGNAIDACRVLSNSKRAATVITSGIAGSYYRLGADGNVTHVPAFEVEAHDTNGCGDTFHGAFGLGIARDLTVHEAVTFASAAAALKAFSGGGKFHGWDSLPSICDVIDFLRAKSDESDVATLLEKIAGWETLEWRERRVITSVGDG